MSDVAVNIIVDSSIALASQWSIIITYYISNLLTRLLEGRSGDSFNIGIVTYATADYRPTPILAKRYFNNPSFVSKELKEDVPKLGIGRTGSGGKMGMAALEGYAAALEMFDLFLSSHRSSKEAAQDKPPQDGQVAPLCHIIHVSACPPDDSRHPLWNQTSNLDTLSWKTLPDELRKRNINLSMILLKPNKNLAELHSSVTPEAHKVWFTIPNAAHTLLLSSQASWAPLTTKRANESSESDKAADTKRARVSTPKQVPAASTPQAAPPPKPAELGAPSNVAQPSSAPPPLVRNNGFAQLQQALTKIRELDPQLKQSQAQIELLRQQGRLQDMENLKRTIQPKMQMYYKLKQFILASQMKNVAAASASVDSTKSVESKRENTAGPSGQNQPTGPGPSNNVPSQPPQAKPSQTIQQLAQAQRQTQQLKAGASSAPDGRPPANILPQFSPSVAAQMQKLQMKEGIQGQVSMSSAPVQQHQPQQQQGLINQPVQHATNLSHNQPPGSNENQNWIGTLSWLGPQPMNSMETQVRVISSANIRPELWPSTLEVELLRDQAVPLPALREWLALQKPVVCQIRPLARSVDPQENLFRFKSLSTLLIERNVYAVSRWAPPPSNVAKPMLLLFPVGGDGSQMAAAVFPETGIPELPRVNPQAPPAIRPNPAPQPGGNVNQAQMLMMLQNMNPEARMQFMARIRQQQMLQAQAQQAVAAAGANGVNGNPANTNLLGNLPGGGWPGSLQGAGVGQGVQNVQAGMPSGMNANLNLAQALAAMQQHQRQNGMAAPPGSGGQPPF